MTYWEGGMPGYLIWLNARLYEMKRLLKPWLGSIYVHLDWHAVHYVKVEMDKIFGAGVAEGSNHPGFRNELHWYYYNRIPQPRKVLGPEDGHDPVLYKEQRLPL